LVQARVRTGGESREESGNTGESDQIMRGDGKSTQVTSDISAPLMERGNEVVVIKEIGLEIRVKISGRT
jgi:hypothetical protein